MQAFHLSQVVTLCFQVIAGDPVGGSARMGHVGTHHEQDLNAEALAGAQRIPPAT
ncbi:MAG: hypothetical protein ABSF23_00905 [Terracidiphilus sp.]|jgi:hypothetical protein